MRRYATTSTGLRRYRGGPRQPRNWEIHWLRNFSIQRSATVFKDASNRLYRRYQNYEARLLAPMHEAFLILDPKAVFAVSVLLSEEVMRSVVQEHDPMLHPQDEINDRYQECWNKDGDAESMEESNANLLGF